MERKLPSDAFEFYVALGPGRSYQKVADKFGVSKRTVTKHAIREKWQERAAELERIAHSRAAERLIETLEEMSTRHLKSLRAIQGKAIEALRSCSFTTAAEASRALEASIRQERTIRGEPGDRTAVSIEDMVRTHHERWVASAEPDFDDLPDPEDDQGDDDEDDADDPSRAP